VATEHSTNRQADAQVWPSRTQEMVYEIKVGEVMTRDVITVGPKELMSGLRELLHRNRISGLPVVEEGRLVGLISVEDFIKWLADREEDCPIAQRMTETVETVHDDDPLVLAIGKFDRSGRGRFPVIDRERGRLVGIVTKGDVIEGLLKKLEIDYQRVECSRDRLGGRVLDGLEADETTLTFRYEVVGRDFARAGASASRLKRTLQSLGFRPDIVRRVAIATYEAEMNLVVFTEGGKIRASVGPAEVRVEVKDAGPGIPDIEKAMEPGYSTAPDWVRDLGFGAGMGLVNIRRSSDTFDLQSEPGKGTRLRISFRISEDDHATVRLGEQARSAGEVGPEQTRSRGAGRLRQRSVERCHRPRPRGRSVDHPSEPREHRCRREHEGSVRDHPGRRPLSRTGYHREGAAGRRSPHGQPTAGIRVGGPALHAWVERREWGVIAPGRPGRHL